MRPVLAVLGTRPEAVKFAPVVRALRRRGLRTVVVSTGQHRELLAAALSEVGLRPAADLRLMRPGLSHARLSAGILGGLPPVLRRLKPALALVQGDTTTAAASALACLYAGVPVGHVEAGLRSFDRANPFPEEDNRVVADHLSALHFAPTPGALANLRREGLGGRWSMLTGNTAVDAVRWAARRAPRRDGGCLLVTLHRRESFGAPLAGMLGALARLSERFPETPFVFPAHPNPAVQAAVRRLPRDSRLRVIAPLPYRGFVGLLASCRFVLTDSGGVQEEAAALGKPVLVARDATERPELIASGGGLLVGRDPRAIERAVERLLEDDRLVARMSRAKNPFGDGKAGERIAAAIGRWLRSRR